ncbi:MAG: polysaccharide export protein [Methylobacter sp.]
MKTFFYIACFSLIAGCSVVPGMHMYTYTPSVPGVTITPITAESVRAQIVKEPEQSSLAKPVDEKPYQYIIGPHDVLSVTVWEHPELTLPAGEFRAAETVGHLVAEDGTVFFPYAGTIKVAGKTAGEIRTLLTKGLSTVIEDPQVDVKVAVFRSQKAYVSGEVVKPGAQPITDVPLTVTEAIGLAGDLTPEADLANAVLTHNGEASKINLLSIYDKGDVRKNILLQNGDILHIPDRNSQKVFVMGEVAKPSSIVIHKRGITLTEALSDAGGINPATSDPEHIFVVRADGDKSEVFVLAAESPDALILGDQFRLKPHDVVYVEATDGTRWSRTIDQLVSTSTVVRNFGRIVGAQ